MNNQIEYLLACDQVEDQYEGLKDLLINHESLTATDLQTTLDMVKSWGQLGYRHLQIRGLEALKEVHPIPAILVQLAEALLILGDYEEADQLLSQLTESSISIDEQLLKAQVKAIKGDLLVAKTLYQEIIQEHPRDYRAYEALVKLFNDQGYWDTALEYYQILWEYFLSEASFKRKEWRLQLAKLYLLDEQMEAKVIEDLWDETGLVMDSADEFYLMALAYQQMDRTDAALEKVAQGLLEEKDHLELRFLELDLLVSQAQFEQFNSRLQELLQYLPPYDNSLLDLLELCIQAQIYPAELMLAIMAYFPLISDLEEQFQAVTVIMSSLEETNINPALWQKVEEFLDQIEDPTLQAYARGKSLFIKGDYPAALPYLTMAAKDPYIVFDDLNNLINKAQK